MPNPRPPGAGGIREAIAVFFDATQPTRLPTMAARLPLTQAAFEQT